MDKLNQPQKLLDLLEKSNATEPELKEAEMAYHIFLAEVKTTVNHLAIYKQELQTANKALIKEAANFECDMMRESSNSRIANFILGFRRHTDDMVKNNFPSYITNSGLSFVNQWRVMFRNKNDAFVQIFTQRLAEYKLTEHQFFNSIKSIRSKMNFDCYEGDIPEIESESEWIEIYRTMKIRDYEDKSALKILGTGITQAECESTYQRLLPQHECRAVLLAKGFPEEYEESDIKQLLEPKPKGGEPIIKDVVIVKNDDTGISMGEAFVYVDTYKHAAVIYCSMDEHKFMKEVMVDGIKTSVCFATLKMDKPYPSY